ncbi:MAG: pyridoxamine 5'-phosphate oxidase family protein [Prevotellaceae bacterium]|nr:pyridoxamine 5'-phosphate oxidase family protein [Prevotellaceae bacterium]
MEQKFIAVIKEHHVLTLATSFNDEPYCSNMFYAFLEQDQFFVFSSESKTHHMRQVAHNMFAAASIFLETETIGKIQGIQLQGMVYQPSGDIAKRAKKAYLQRFPYATLISTSFWIFEPTWAKLTDNRLGFGKKLIWEKEALVDISFLNSEK